VLAFPGIFRGALDAQATTITEKMKVVDRALKLEALKQKADMDEWGSGFMSGDDEE
jgi:malic enzyme